jgi:immune inhibitor A
LRTRIKEVLSQLSGTRGLPGALGLRAAEPKAYGLNEGTIIPPEHFPLGTSPSVITRAAAERAPLRGTVRAIVVLVDFNDKHMGLSQQHYRDLFFSSGVLQTKSVREYYQEVTNGLIDLQGDVVGPFRLPQSLATYSHGASGMGNPAPNAQTMAQDAANAAKSNVNFAPYDNDGNGFVGEQPDSRGST